MREDEFPYVSILISTRGRKKLLAKALSSVFKMDYPRDKYEVVVVEETNSPQPLAGVRYISIPEEGRGVAYSRGIALKNARFDIVAFTDDDCEVEKDWLRQLIAPLIAKEGVGAGGTVLVKDTNAIGYAESLLGFPGGGLKYYHQAQGKWRSTRFLSTCNCAYFKDKIIEVGGFERGLRYIGEDLLISLRLSSKYPLIYNPKAVVYHLPRASLGRVFNWFVGRGKTDINLAKFVPKMGFYNWLVRSSFSLKLLLALFLMLILPFPFWVTLFSVVLFYYLFLIYRYRFGYRYLGKLLPLLVLPIVKLTMDMGFEWGRISYLITSLTSKLKGKDERDINSSNCEE
jgi:cellulose synthase/poly-beta-1,6-N-acetylglucosamine synthase-like glycosyltransferase